MLSKFQYINYCIYDPNPLKSGSILDLKHAAALNSTICFHANNPDFLPKADIIVFAAGANLKIKKSRTEVIQPNISLVQDWLKDFKSINNPWVIVATNPVDPITRVFVESGKFEKDKILGAGTLLDSARLNFWLEETFTLPNGTANTLVLGEHGEKLVICTHNSRIGKKLLSEFIIENKIEIQQLINSMQTAASLIKATQDATYYGIAASLVKIIEGILVPNPEKTFSLSVASNVKDGWNLGNVVISLPVKIASKGFKIELAEKFSEEIRLEISNISEFFEQQWKNVQLKGNN